MNKVFITSTLALLLAGSLCAAPGGTIIRKDGTSAKAGEIQGQTISGIHWADENDRPGGRIKPWEIDIVRYKGQGMDEFNSLPRKLAGGQGDQLIKAAESYLKGDPEKGFKDEEWQRDVVISAMYFAAMGYYFKGEYDEAASELELYIKEAEGNISDVSGTLSGISFTSAVTRSAVRDGGGLNRYYLDALENLALAYQKAGEAKKANDIALKTLSEITNALRNSGDEEYYDWNMRGLRAAAQYAESQGDYKGAREAYEELTKVAVNKAGGKQTRASYEANLKVGFMQIKEGETRAAKAKFYVAIKEWEEAHKVDKVDDGVIPRRGWIDPDVAYLTAGSYVGQGMVLAADAKKNEDWGEALTSFSMALSIFSAADDIRAMALLGAANASSELAKASASDATVADTYAKQAEKYLSELTTLLPKSKEAEDPSVAEIQKTINKYKKAN